MTKYAEILDNSWLTEEVPESFPNSSKEVDEILTQKTWEEYCTNSADEFNGCTKQEKTFIRFKYKGKTDIELGDYSSDKLKFITKREYDIWEGNHYLIHLFTEYPINTSPENIDWQSEINTGLEPKPYSWGTILHKTFYYNDLPIIKKEYECTRDENRLKTQKVKKFHWYKADGTSMLLKTLSKDITVKAVQVNDLIKETNYAIDGAYAFTVGTPLESYAKAYFEANVEAERNSRRTGDESFKNQIATETSQTQPWMFLPYDTSHLTHEHNLDNPTIQDALISYLTF